MGGWSRGWHPDFDLKGGWWRGWKGEGGEVEGLLENTGGDREGFGSVGDESDEQCSLREVR